MAFTVRATPAPTADVVVTVSVSVTETGNMLADGPRTETLTIGMSGSATLTLRTVDDDTDEDDSVVTATLIADSGYTLGTASSDMVTVTDDDQPSTGGRPLPPEVDVVTISPVSSRVTEGAQVAFTVRATPAPTTDVVVTVSVTETGGNRLAGGPRTETLTIGTSASATLTLETVDDPDEEPNSTVTATITGVTDATDTYTSSSRNRVARVTVADDDGSGGSDPPQTLVVRLVSVTPSSVTEGQTLSVVAEISPAPSSAQRGGVYAVDSAAGRIGNNALRFTATRTTRTVDVLVPDTPAVETDRTVRVTLDSAFEDPDNGYVLGTPSSLTVDVTDTDT